tara:strand:- start:444 stop:1004 length:561 start_codon:yes stop_codon:yes gene_type:complete
MMHETDSNVMNSFPTKRRNKLNWRDIISLKHSAEEIWDVQTQNNKRDWGKLLHLVLSKISYANEKERVINEMYNLGKFAKEDYQKLQKVIRDLVMHPDVRVFFTNEWDVKNEKEILMNNGKTYIPDRLLFSKNKDRIVIIDYKTGQEFDKHKHQISEYANVLNLMFKTNVESILIYTSPTIKIVKI